MKYSLLIALCAAALVQAQEPKTFPEIIDAKKAFDKDKMELDVRYADEITKARARYLDLLNGVRVKAVAAGNVDLAQDALFRAREVEKDVLRFAPPDDPPAVEIKGRLTVKDLAGRKFMYAPVPAMQPLTLGDDGKIKEYVHPNESFWRVTADGKMVFFNKDGRTPTFVFSTFRQGNGKMYIEGTGVLGANKGISVMLRETP